LVLPAGSQYLCLVTSEIGSVGLLLFLASLATFIVHIYRKRKTESGALIIAVVGAVFIIALFDHWLYSLHFGIICAGALIGLLANASQAETLTE
jgi:Kef-type K+ transport system membrane component KefB